MDLVSFYCLGFFYLEEKTTYTYIDISLRGSNLYTVFIYIYINILRGGRGDMVFLFSLVMHYCFHIMKLNICSSIRIYGDAY